MDIEQPELPGMDYLSFANDPQHKSEKLAAFDPNRDLPTGSHLWFSYCPDRNQPFQNHSKHHFAVNSVKWQGCGVIYKYANGRFNKVSTYIDGVWITED